MPIVDIITPAHNAEKYLGIAIESVLAQTFPNWRLILVDDGSTDGTHDIAAHYRALIGDRMLMISQDNKGPSAARNLALSSSTAPFLALLDADDVWLPSRLAESVTLLQANPNIGLSYGLITRIDQDGSITGTFAENDCDAEGWVATDIYKRKLDLPSPTITFRRECVDAVGLFDETMRATEDRDLWLRIALKFEIAFIPKVLAQYRSSGSSASTDFERMAEAQLTFIRKHYGSPGCNSVARQIAISRVYKQRAEGYKERGLRAAALCDAYRACMLWPFAEENWRTAISLSLTCVGLKK